MNQTSADYTFGIASLEIILLLLASFLLGMLLCWLLRKMGLCCKVRDNDLRQGSLGYPSTTKEGGRKPREFPGEQVKSGGYTADINSLLRNQDPEPQPAAAPLRSEGIVAGAAAIATASVASITASGTGHKDDLKKLEGIGPKLEKILNAAGIQNFEQLAGMTSDQIKPILESAGSQFRMHDPKSWPYQAELAVKGEWDRLKEYQNLLIRGN